MEVYIIGGSGSGSGHRCGVQFHVSDCTQLSYFFFAMKKCMIAIGSQKYWQKLVKTTDTSVLFHLLEISKHWNSLITFILHNFVGNSILPDSTMLQSTNQN